MREPAADSTMRFRHALSTFATGVTVVTTKDSAGQPRGFTANSFTSVSLAPPLILVCLSREGAACPVFSSSRHFCINVLAEHQQALSHQFAAPGGDRFAGVEWGEDSNGCPLLAGVISRFSCEKHEIHDGGDHVILVGRVLDYDFDSQSPLVYCGGSYVEFGLAQKAMEAASGSVLTRVSAIVDCDRSIPMQRDGETGRLSLPTASQVGNAGEPDSLIGKLAADGIEAAVPFVCSVYEDSGSRTHNIVYRGTADRVDATSLQNFEMISLDRIPWDELIDTPLKMLLERYLEESERDAFGVYVGDAERGEVRTLRAGS